MASPVGAPAPPQQRGACSSSSRAAGLRVLNAAASHLVLERTLVEAFVKLVVCRKVTVQRVAAASGQVLDSHTTQEEDVPVILDVHRHEVGGDCSSSRWSPGLPFAMDHPHHPPSPSAPQLNSERRHQMSSEGRDRHRRDTGCDSSQRKGPLQRPSELEGSACGDGETERGLHRNHSPVNHPTAMCGTGKPRERKEERDKDQPVKADVHLHTISVCEKRGKSDSGSDVTMHASKGSTELKSNDASAGSASDDFIEMDGSERTDRRKQYERLIAKNLNSPQYKESREDPASTSERKDSSRQELKEAMDEQDSLPCGEDGELMEDTSVELNEESEQGLHGGMESREDPEKWTEHGSDGVDDLEQDVEMATLDGDDAAATPDLKWKGESVAMRSDLEEQQLTAKPWQTSRCKSPSAGMEDKDQGQRDTKGNLGNSNAEKEVSFDLGDGSLNIDTTADQHSEVKREASEGEMGSGNSQLEQSSQPSEYNTEQDMLVIDISNTVLEQTHQNTDTEQTHPTTDDEQTSPNTVGETSHSTTESKQTRPDANSEKIDQNVDIDSQSHHIADHRASSSGWEQRTQSLEKPDPFVHLLTNFPVMDRSHSKESHPQGKAKQGRSRTTSDSSAIRSTSHPIKEELDDDCMITAAFISPPNREGRGQQQKPVSHTVTRENRGQQQKPVSHTVTRENRVVEQRPGVSSQSLAAPAMPGRVWRGGMSPRQRSTAGQWGQYFPSASSALLPVQQFRQPVQGFQANPSMATVAAAASTSAVGYQGRASSLRAESSIPAALSPVPHGFVPNFLSPASWSEVSDCADSGAVEDGSGAPVTDLSCTFQCPLCSKIFMHQHKFSRHLAMCGGCRPFKCKICNKAFNQRAHLDTHMKFHRGIKRYKCDVCQKAYVMKGDLIRHLKTRSHLMVLQSYGLPVQ